MTDVGEQAGGHAWSWINSGFTSTGKPCRPENVGQMLRGIFAKGMLVVALKHGQDRQLLGICFVALSGGNRWMCT
jgi:hypothetical protein